MESDLLKKTFLDNLFLDFSKNIDISPEDWAYFSSLFTLKEFAKGEKLLAPGDRSDLVYYIGSGAVKREILSQTGKAQVISFDGPGRIVSDFVSLIEGHSCRIYIEALTPTYALEGEPNFLQKLREKSSIWDKNGRIVAEKRYAEKCSREFNLLYYEAKERVKMFLAEFEDILPFIAKKDMANYIGITPESLHRIIRTEKTNF